MSNASKRKRELEIILRSPELLDELQSPYKQLLKLVHGLNGFSEPMTQTQAVRRLFGREKTNSELYIAMHKFIKLQAERKIVSPPKTLKQTRVELSKLNSPCYLAKLNRWDTLYSMYYHSLEPKQYIVSKVLEIKKKELDLIEKAPHLLEQLEPKEMEVIKRVHAIDYKRHFMVQALKIVMPDSKPHINNYKVMFGKFVKLAAEEKVVKPVYSRLETRKKVFEQRKKARNRNISYTYSLDLLYAAYYYSFVKCRWDKFLVFRDLYTEEKAQGKELSQISLRKDHNALQGAVNRHLGFIQYRFIKRLFAHYRKTNEMPSERQAVKLKDADTVLAKYENYQEIVEEWQEYFKELYHEILIESLPKHWNKRKSKPIQVGDVVYHSVFDDLGEVVDESTTPHGLKVLTVNFEEKGIYNLASHYEFRIKSERDENIALRSTALPSEEEFNLESLLKYKYLR